MFSAVARNCESDTGIIYNNALKLKQKMQKCKKKKKSMDVSRAVSAFLLSEIPRHY